MKIVFMGTPDFAVPSLDILVEHGYEVVGVVTATDKLGGRGGKQLIESAVKKYAVSKGLKVLQPSNLKSPSFLEELKSLEADLQVVVAFRMLPEVVWDMPGIGTFNLHGSLLPKYRGAAPINWAIINGEKETGVTTFFIKHEIDTGDVLLQKSLTIGPDDTAGEVHDAMMVLGAQAVLESVQMIESGDYTLAPQKDEEATKAPKIFSEDCKIDFDKDTSSVYNFIRGLSPYPAAWTNLDGKVFKILECRPVFEKKSVAPGGISTDNKSFLQISTQDGWIDIQKGKMEGKRAMEIRDFLNGYKFDV
ncbi:MAG: methionyl-tRNA formyltransferase [Saprospiraceae bacterium]